MSGTYYRAVQRVHTSTSMPVIFQGGQWGVLLLFAQCSRGTWRLAGVLTRVGSQHSTHWCACQHSTAVAAGNAVV